MQRAVLLFANPISGSGRGRRIAGRLEAALRRSDYDVHAFLQPAESVNLADCRDAARASCIIIVGGDGTVRSVVAKLFRTPGLERLPPLLIIPVGTANLLGQHLGIRWDDSNIEQLILNALAAGRVREIDAASANGQPFLIVGGVGLDAAVVHELTRIRSGPIAGRHQYVLPAFKSLSREPFKPLTVKVDGHIIVRQARGMAFVGNIREYGTGFPILPHAKPDDGLLDVCVIPCSTFNQAMLVFLMAAAGEHLSVEQVRYAKGKDIRIESQPQAPVQIDGEAAGFTPVDIRLLPMKVPFIVP